MATQARRIEAMMTGPEVHAVKVEEPESLRRLKAALAPVEFKVAITGTARGVGVSTVAANLALALARADREGRDGEFQQNLQIGILDLGVRSTVALDPAGVRVLSLEALLGGPPALQRGVRTEWQVVQECLTSVDWKGIDFLLVELPFGIEAVGDFSEVFPAMDAACIVSRPTDGVRDRIRRVWKFFDEGSIPVIGLISNMEGRFEGEGVESLGQTSGIPLRVEIPYEPALATFQAGVAPYIVANKEARVGSAVFDFSDDLVDYLFWLRGEHDQEEDF